jgi:hypothetical protein
MKYGLILIFGLVSTLAFAQSEEVESLKTIIKDTGAKERADVKALEDCKSVMTEQQRLMQMIRPEYKQRVTLKEVSVLEVFRADNTTGYAAKCIFKFPSK